MKYKINDTVYKLTDGKITEHQVLGVVQTYTEDTKEYVSGRETNFFSYYYYQIYEYKDVGYQMEKLGMEHNEGRLIENCIPEPLLFSSKEELLNSL